MHFFIIDFHVGDLYFKAGVFAPELSDPLKHEITQSGNYPLPHILNAPHHCVGLA